MDISVQNLKDMRGTPYKCLVATPELTISVEIRQYSQNTFISYQDDRENPFSGADLEDCFLTPAVLWQKVPNWLFEQEIKQYIKGVLDAIELNDFDNSIDELASDICKAWSK